jgi:hypothetical protein
MVPACPSWKMHEAVRLFVSQCIYIDGDYITLHWRRLADTNQIRPRVLILSGQMFWLRKPDIPRDACWKNSFFKVEIMKVIQSLLIAAVVALPALSFAQSYQPLTRADVRAQLVELEKAGYNPNGDQTQYPQNIQAAEARINAQHALVASSYGPSVTGTSGSGSGTHDAGSKVIGLGPIYAKP